MKDVTIPVNLTKNTLKSSRFGKPMVRCTNNLTLRYEGEQSNQNVHSFGKIAPFLKIRFSHT